MTVVRCECEHVAHFHEVQRALTPAGNPGHAYGAKYAAGYIQPVATDYGPFKVCRDCAVDCHHQKEIIA